jgi:hypothetical protein
VIVAVAAPVSVIALVNGSDSVNVVDAIRFESRVLVHGMDHGHGVVPAHERGHDYGSDHVDAHGHGSGHGNVHVTGLDPIPSSKAT